MSDVATVAVLLIFGCNVLILIGVVVVGFRLTESSEQTRTLLYNASAELLEAGRGLRGLSDGVDHMVHRLSSAERQLNQAAQAASGLDGQLMGALEALLTDLARQGALTDERLQSDVRDMVQVLKQMPVHQFSDWFRSNRGEVEQVMSQCELLASENEQLRACLDDVRQQAVRVTSVEAAKREAEESARRLQQEMAEVRMLLSEHRQRAVAADQRANSAEGRVDALSGEAEDLRASIERQQAEAQQAMATAREELARVQAEHERVQREMARMTGAMERMAIEKDFIEQKFLGLDESADVAAS